MGLFSPSPSTSTSSGQSTSTVTPAGYLTSEWGNILGTGMGLTTGPGGIVNNYGFPGGYNAMVAAPTSLTNQYWGQAAGLPAAAPNMGPNANAMTSLAGGLAASQVSPSVIGLPSFNAASFQPGQLNLPSFGQIPSISGLQQVQAPATYSPQQIAAMQVAAPGAVNPITGVPNVSPMALTNYQMSGVGNVSAPSLNQYAMNAAPSVSGGQSWNAPGVAASYMSPYTQNVVNTQLAQAQVQEQQQLEQQNAQAAQAGAFGGNRAAVEAANTSIGYQQMAAGLEAQGLQSAYTAGQQQFNVQQQMGLQAALANQQAQQQANQANLQSQLSTQQLGATTGLQAALANQQMGYNVGAQNLGANLQTQQLGATTGLQAALANQQMGYQTQLANQQAQEFGLGQQMQAQLANQQAGLTAEQANQAAGLQTGLAGMQYRYGASQANAANALQAGLANQAAAMQGLGMTYQGGLQGALQTQNLGLSGAEFGGQLGLSAAQNQYGLQQQQQQINQAAMMNAANLQQGAGQLGLMGYSTGLQGVNALAQAAQSQQGYQQQLRDAAYQNWMNQYTLPMQGLGWLAGMTAMQPQAYSTQNAYSGTSTGMQGQPSIFGQLLGGVLGGVGLAGLFGLKKGGLVKKPSTGIAAIPRPGGAAREGLGRYAAAA